MCEHVFKHLLLWYIYCHCLPLFLLQLLYLHLFVILLAFAQDLVRSVDREAELVVGMERQREGGGAMGRASQHLGHGHPQPTDSPAKPFTITREMLKVLFLPLSHLPCDKVASLAPGRGIWCWLPQCTYSEPGALPPATAQPAA